MKSTLNATWWLMIITGAVFAQHPAVVAPVQYDLSAVIARTLATNPDIKAAEQTVDAARARVHAAQAQQRPQATAQLGYSQLDQTPSFTVSGMGTMAFGKVANPFADVTLQWPLYTGGMIEHMVAASRQGVEASLHGFARTRQEIAAEAAVGYYQALSAERMIEVMRAQITTLTEAVRVATTLHQQGMVAKLDVLRPSAELTSSQTMLTQAENGYQLALANLRRLMNLPSTAPIELASTEPVVEASADLSAATATALAQRPEVKQLHAYQLAAAARQDAARGQTRPHLGLQAQYDLKRPSTYPEIGHWSVGLVLQQSLTDGGATRAQAAELDAQLRELAAKDEALRQGITMQVQHALLNLQAAKSRTQSSATALEAALEAYRMADVSYKSQVVPMTDVLATQTALTNARTQQALAEFDQQVAIVQLRLALGDFPAEPASITQ